MEATQRQLVQLVVGILLIGICFIMPLESRL